MTETLFFYDLETTGFFPRDGRIMQFAGQRTSLDLKPIGEPINLYIRLTTDILPDPGAILTTGITPQKTQEVGLSEADFIDSFEKLVNQAGTTYVGYNNIRFDDDFMRFLFYRNLYDPYTWQWQDGRSRWDLLDVVRMTRALRPEGINWPFDENSKPSNRLGLLTSSNKLIHLNAHDALSDVQATIALAQLLFYKQPKLFKFLYEHRRKDKVADIVLSNKPFLYTSGKYSSEYEKTTVVQVISKHPSRNGALVYDLRFDPEPFAKMSVEELAKAWRPNYSEETLKLPVKSLLFNRCPAVAPLIVLGDSSKMRLKLDLKKIAEHQASLRSIKDFETRIIQAQELLDENQEKKILKQPLESVDAKLYDGFFADSDKRIMQKVHQTSSASLNELKLHFSDERLNELFPLYVARNYPEDMTDDQRSIWTEYRKQNLFSGGKKSKFSVYTEQLSELRNRKLSSRAKKIIDELESWGETVKAAD